MQLWNSKWQKIDTIVQATQATQGLKVFRQLGRNGTVLYWDGLFQ